MKFKFIYTIFALTACSVLFTANKAGRAFSQGKGNTGAPGDETLTNGTARTCQTCHSTSATIQVTLDIEVLDDSGTPITEYTPDQTFDVKVTINSLGAETPVGYGFQILCLKAPLGVPGDDAASFSNPGNNVRIAVASSNGRQYAEHKGPSATKGFMVEWTAPPVGTGTITFYSCGNGVNLNDMTSGDGAACSQLQLTEGDPVATKEISEEVSLTIFPNPADDVLNLEIDSRVSGTFKIRIYNLLGQLVKTKQLDLISGENKELINLSDLPKGNYLLQLTDGEKMTSRKIMKL